MKYKLIKEYPGSPKLGTIRNWNPNIWSDNNDFKENKTFAPNNYPEFWEEIVEKDYEILNFISTENNIAQLSYFTCENNFTGNNIWKIYSIKRKSDGEIFTIGDKVVGYNNSIAKIKTIDLVGEISLNIGTDKSEGFSLKNLKKVKQPLFTTEQRSEIEEIIKNIIK